MEPPREVIPEGESPMTDTKQASEKLVRDFLGSWEGRDLETICGAFADDAVYHNAPVATIEGVETSEQDRRGLEAKLDVVTLAAEPGLVLAERVDYFTMGDGTNVVLPVTGVFVVRNGEIARFTDYFDLADFERQSGFKL